MSRLALALALFLFAACAAPAAQTHGTAPPGATAPAAEVSDGNEPVCHEEATTGSNMTRTVCRTKSQEERDRGDAQTFSTKNSRSRQTTKGN